MDPKDYVNGALRTESCFTTFNGGNLGLSESKIRLLHAVMGLCTESGELTDQLKKHLYYGAELDRVNIIEEAGDILWYLAILFDDIGTTFGEVMSTNIAKLRGRYPEKFTSKYALQRDLNKERHILERGSSEKDNREMAKES